MYNGSRLAVGEPCPVARQCTGRGSCQGQRQLRARPVRRLPAWNFRSGGAVFRSGSSICCYVVTFPSTSLRRAAPPVSTDKPGAKHVSSRAEEEEVGRFLLCASYGAASAETRPDSGHVIGGGAAALILRQCDAISHECTGCAVRLAVHRRAARSTIELACSDGVAWILSLTLGARSRSRGNRRGRRGNGHDHRDGAVSVGEHLCASPGGQLQDLLVARARMRGRRRWSGVRRFVKTWVPRSRVPPERAAGGSAICRCAGRLVPFRKLQGKGDGGGDPSPVANPGHLRAVPSRAPPRYGGRTPAGVDNSESATFFMFRSAAT